MEIFTLGPTFQPDRLVENYESFIWTERYLPSGDFELMSGNVQEMLNIFPPETPTTLRETYLSLRETTVPMIAETYKIHNPPRAAPKITIKGRSFESVLERRASVKDLPASTARPAWYIPAAKESDAAYKAMRRVVGDFPRYQNDAQVLPLLNPAVSNNDAISEIDLTLPADFETTVWNSATTYGEGDTVGSGATIYAATSLSGNLNKPPSTEPTYWTPLWVGTSSGTWPASQLFEIKPADLYNTVLGLLAINHRGIKSVRPAIGGSTVGIEIYNGADLTNDVVFDAKFDQFDDAKYLLSNQGSANIAYVYGDAGSQIVEKNEPADEPTGLRRRVLLVDQSSDSATSTDTTETRKSRGLVELYKYNATALFDGQVADQVSSGYNTEYFLGDILKLNGEYGLSQNVRVAEFIRTSDATGEKAYPTFEAVV